MEKTYEIKEEGCRLNCKTYQVYINGRFISAYLNKEDALLKIKNSQNHYVGCPKEEVKNVMFHSNNNNHNCII